MLETHLFIEFYYNHNNGFISEQINTNNKGLLLEEYGVFPGFEEISKSVVHGLKQGKTLFRIKQTDYVDSSGKRKPYPIRTIEILNDENLDDRMAYVPSLSKFSENGTIDKLVILKSSELTIDNTIIPLLMHELTHAIEDYGLNQSGKRLSSELRKSGYFDYANINSKDAKQLISDIFYFLNKFETNSYITQLNGELSQYNGQFRSFKDLYAYLKSLPVYRKYMEMTDIAYNLTDDSIPEKSKYMILDIVNSISNYKFTTYNQFIKFLENKLYKLKRKLYKVIPKIVFGHGYMLTFATKPIGLTETVYNTENVLKELINKV